MRYGKGRTLTALFMSDWTPKTFAILPEAFNASNRDALRRWLKSAKN